MNNRLQLRYGMNPQQEQANLSVETGELPLRVLNGAPGYVNLLDALNSWQLVRDLCLALNLPAAASFKHVSPAGAAVAVPLTETLRRAYRVGEGELSPLATAYARARGADRLSSFGDWIALSDPVDVPVALLIKREVSDGIIAPAYEPQALEILSQKKKGSYCVLQIDPAYEPPLVERRDVFGLTLSQERNSAVPAGSDLAHIVTINKELSPEARRDMLVALVALKYTQSNSVCFAYDGQLIGVGAGQQSRIHCTRLAAAKADNWFLRQHPAVLDLPFRQSCGRSARDNAVDQYLQGQWTEREKDNWLLNFVRPPGMLTAQEKLSWITGYDGVTLGSDAFFPFRDSIDRAQRSGVQFVVQPGGSVRDADVTAACNEYGMVMVLSGSRLFHH